VKLGKLHGFISNFSVLNDTTSKVSVNICYPGANVNKSYISRETLEAMSATLLGCALVGEIKDGKFTDHGERLVHENGAWKLEYNTQPYGFVDKSPDLANIRWETINDKEYLTCDAFLWTGRYPELIEIFQNNTVEQSMEIWVRDGNIEEDDLYHIYDAVFIGLCMLGTAPPAFEDAKVQMYTVVPDEYLQMVSLIKNSLKEEDAKLVFNHEEFAQTYGMTAKQLCELLQKAVDAKYVDADDDSRYWVDDYDSEYVYTKNWYTSDRLAFPYTVENGAVTIDFEKPRKYIMAPVFVDESPEEDMPSTFDAAKSYCEQRIEEFKDAFTKKAEAYDTLQEQFSAKEEELTKAQNDLEAEKQQYGALEAKYNEIYKAHFEVRAKEVYEQNTFAKRVVTENEAEELIKEFAENPDIEAFSNKLDLMAVRKLKENPSVMSPENDEFVHMDATRRFEKNESPKETKKNYSPYPGKGN
jgi:hypothetical protein